VLLKERNMIMTMEEEYTEQGELMPNPERLEKVCASASWHELIDHLRSGVVYNFGRFCMSVCLSEKITLKDFT